MAEILIKIFDTKEEADAEVFLRNSSFSPMAPKENIGESSLEPIERTGDEYNVTKQASSFSTEKTATTGEVENTSSSPEEVKVDAVVEIDKRKPQIENREPYFEKAKIYLKPGEESPKGAVEEIGPRGGRFYETKEIKEVTFHNIPKYSKIFINSAIKKVPEKHSRNANFIGYNKDEEKWLIQRNEKGRFIGGNMAEYRGNGNIHLSRVLFELNDDYLKMIKGYYYDLPISSATCAIIHELGHKVHDDYHLENVVKQLADVYPNKGATLYAERDDSGEERFAEAYLYYIIKPEILKRKDPAMFNFIEMRKLELGFGE